MRLLLVRHGQSEGNFAGVVQGRLDFSLTPLGIRQAEATAERLAAEQVDRILSSPLRRAMETALVISERLGLPIEQEPGLMEYDMGEVSGLTGAEIRERYPEFVAQWQKGLRPAFPGEEGRDAFHARVGAVLEAAGEKRETVVAVAHGGVVSAVCYAVMGLDPQRRGIFETANCALTEVRRDRTGRLVLMKHNDTCHLDGIVTDIDRG
jgi:broad specificity phosphatase PhoE